MIWKYSCCVVVATALMAQTPEDLERRAREMVVMTRAGGSFLGVAVIEVTAERAKALKLGEERGVEVTKVDDDSPAAKAGLKVGDVVLEYQGQRVEGTEQFIRMVRETPSGRNVKLAVSRNGAVQTLMATVAARKVKAWGPEQFHVQIPEIPPMHMPDVPNAFLSWRSGMLGVEAESLSPQLADFFGVKEGVLIRSVGKGTPAEKAGLKAGDVIQKVDDAKVTSPMEITQAIRSLDGKRNVQLSVVRERKEIAVPVTLEDMQPRGERIPKAQTVRVQEQNF
jgi:serine protease Do